MTPSWIWAGASAAGIAHLAQGLPCQDSFACKTLRQPDGTPILVAALADGAGSAACAEQGAVSATASFIDVICRALENGTSIDMRGDLMHYAAKETKFNLEFDAETAGHDASAYASTLIGAVLAPWGGLVGQIGDGAAVIDDGSAGWAPVHWPDHGEYANTTSFLTQPDALDHLQIRAFETPIRRIALFSDGLERLVLDFRTRTAHRPFFESIFSPLLSSAASGHCQKTSEDLLALLASDTVNLRTDDDKSLVCAALTGV